MLFAMTYLEIRVEAGRRALVAFELYRDLGTMRAVGAAMGITGERVRQLLRLGDRRGLFSYPGREYLRNEA